MNENLALTESSKQAITIARAFAREFRHETFSPAHLLKALLHKEVALAPFLQSIGKDVHYLADWADVRIESYPKSGKAPEEPKGDKQVSTVFEEADNVRLKLGLHEISPICLLVALAKPNIGFTPDQLKTFPILEKEILDLYLSDTSVQGAILPTMGNNGSQGGAKSTGALLKYCIDRTSKAKEGKYDAIIGRDKEVRMVTEVLGRRSKPNVILTGEPGVGKTALIDGFCLNIVAGDVPETLKNASVFELDLGALIAGASYKGEIEDRLKNIVKEVKQFEKPILFIDEIHTLFDPQGPAGNGAANLLKPELARGELTVIGATTNEEYRKIFEKDDAISRRFETLRIEEPDIKAAIKMLEKILPKFEEHHKLKVAKAAVADCVIFAKRYSKDRRLPDSAVDLLDRTMAAIKMMSDTTAQEVGKLRISFEELRALKDQDAVERLSELRWFHTVLRNKVSPVILSQAEDEIDPNKIESPDALEDFIHKLISRLEELSLNTAKDTVERSDIAAVVSYKTGIPLGKIQSGEAEKLKTIDVHLRKRVVGQDIAIQAIADAIYESRSGLNKPGQPIGGFFLSGPTGTGKTELVKAIAEYLFNDEKAMIRFDMSEFKEEHSTSLMIGSPPGYVGYENGGELVNKIRQNPYSVVLFDEIEKAHKAVFDIFLQVLDEGKLNDRLGKTGDFSNSIIFFTSNIGSEWIIEKFGKNEVPKSSDLIEIMAKHFRPEFLARLTEVVPFAPISEDLVVKILDIHLKGLLELLDKQGIKLTIDAEAKKKFALTGFTPKYGARQINGVIRNQLRRPISKMIIGGQIKKGDHIIIKMKGDDEVVWEVISQEVAKELVG